MENIEQPSVRAFLKQQGTYDAKFSKEQADYVDALNKQEVAEKVNQKKLLERIKYWIEFHDRSWSLLKLNTNEPPE